MKKFKLLILIPLLLITISCSDVKTYKNDGIEITMPKGFKTKVHDTANIYYENDEVFVIGIKESYDILLELDINPSSSVEDYANKVLENTELSSTIEYDDNLLYYTYEYEINNKTYYYVSTFHKNKEGFFVCNFGCELKNKEKYHHSFINWAKTISFK